VRRWDSGGRFENTMTESVLNRRLNQRFTERPPLFFSTSTMKWNATNSRTAAAMSPSDTHRTL
jgi:hypothetical protein